MAPRRRRRQYRRRRGDFGRSANNESTMSMSSARLRSVAMVVAMCCLACSTPPSSAAWLVAYAYASPAHPLLSSSCSVSRRLEARGRFPPRGAFGSLFLRGGGEPEFDAPPAMPRYEVPDISSSGDEKGGVEEDEQDLSALGEALGDEGDNEASILEEVDDDEPRAMCDRGIVIIDNFSPYHGNYLARMAREAYGAGVVSALSEYVTGFLYQERGMTEHLSDRLPDLESMEDVERWISEIPFEIIAIVCESDSGLDDAERLGEALGLYPDRHDGFNAARRNKFLMNEVCEGAGLRVVRQKMCETLEEAIEFASELGVRSGGHADGADIVEPSEMPGESKRDEGVQEDELHMSSNIGLLGMATNDHTDGSSLGKYCVVKPSRGVASDDVHLCPDLDSVQAAFTRIKDSSVFGSMHGEKNDKVLVQEFASGTEYAIDIVSKAGHHKVAALWRYDKRPANGAPFVYHATELVDADTDGGRAICEYVMDALNVLNVHWGISHNEVIVDADGPRLVEVNLRQHNTDFAPLTSACIGYNALDMLLAAYLGGAEEFPPNTEDKRLDWDGLPDLPVTRAYGAIVHLVSHSEGILAGLNIPALEEIEQMESVLAMELYPHYTAIGENIEKTVDIRTDSGWLHIMNDNPVNFKADYDRVVELMPHMFLVEEEGGNGGDCGADLRESS